LRNRRLFLFPHFIVCFIFDNLLKRKTIIMKNILISAILVMAFINVNAAVTDSLSRNLDDFHALKLFGNIKLTLKKSTSNSLIMTSKTYDISKVITKVDKGVLTLKSNAMGDAKEVIITLYYKSIDEIKVDAGANIVQTDTLDATNLTIKLVKGSLMRGIVSTGGLTITLNQGSEIRLSGTAKNLWVTSNTGAYFDSFKLIARNAEVKAATGGKINVTAKDKIKASAKMGGVIVYKGNPKAESVEPGSGGEIIKK
jgi:hypothetical protein